MEEATGSWKLYQNPFYEPIWYQTQLKPILLDTDLDVSRAQIVQLNADLEFERKARKKAESANKRLAREVAEERLERQALERVCQELATKISSYKSDIDRLKREVDEERKMLRTAQSLREERVQMKLAEAKVLLEEKLSELDDQSANKPQEFAAALDFPRKFSRLVLGEKFCNGDSTETRKAVNLRVEAKNPHIKRGIKGFVEYPKVIRAIGSRSRNWGAKLECQKAQLRILLKQKS